MNVFPKRLFPTSKTVFFYKSTKFWSQNYTNLTSCGEPRARVILSLSSVDVCCLWWWWCSNNLQSFVVNPTKHENELFKLWNDPFRSQCFSQYVSRVVKYSKKSLQHLTSFLMSTWWKICKKSNSHWWLLEGRPKQGKIDAQWAGLVMLSSHYQNEISCIFL